MRDETRKKLGELMDTYDRKRREAKRRAKEKGSAEVVFLGTFSVCRDETIIPAMREIGELLRSRGHQYGVLATGERIDADGKTIPAAVTLEFYPAGIARRRFAKRTVPHVSFIAQPSTGKVLVYENSVAPRVGGWFGNKGEFSLDEIDGDFVEEQILPMIEEVLTSLSR